MKDKMGSLNIRLSNQTIRKARKSALNEFIIGRDANYQVQTV